MINPPDRGEALRLIDEAVHAGARQALACQALGLTVRTVQRWRLSPSDRRPHAPRPRAANQLSDFLI